jgi:serine/threonine-protein kinase RsbT
MYQAQNVTTATRPDFPLFQSPDDIIEQQEAFSTRTLIESIEDIVVARQVGRLLAQELGYSTSRSTLVTTVISELARNIVLYAGSGEIMLSRVNRPTGEGIVITAVDSGPGISNIQQVLRGGVSSSGGLGLGLAGVRQLADDFRVLSVPGEGTKVIVGVWRH